MTVTAERPTAAGSDPSAGLGRAVARGALWSAGDKWVLRFGQLATFVVLARLVSPRDFGVVAFAAAVIEVFRTFAEQGISQYVVINKQSDERVLSTAFWINVLASGSLAALVIVLAPLAAQFSSPTVVPVLRVLALFFVIRGLGVVQDGILQRDLQFKGLAVRSMAATLIGGASGIVVGLLGGGVWALVTQTLAQALASTVVLWTATHFRPSARFSRAEAKNILGFSWKVLGIDGMTSVVSQGDNFVVGIALGPVALGYYAIAWRLLGVLTDLFVGVLSTVSLPAFAKISHDRAATARALLKATKLSLAIAIPAFLCAAVAASPMITLVFGSRWHSSAELFQILTVGGLLGSLTYFDRAILLTAGRSVDELVIVAVAAVATIVAAAVGSMVSLVAVAVLISARLYVTWPIRLYYLRKATGVSLRSYLEQFLTALGCGAVLLAVGFGLDHKLAHHGLIVRLVVPPVGAAVAFVVAAACIDGEFRGLVAAGRSRLPLGFGRTDSEGPLHRFTHAHETWTGACLAGGALLLFKGQFTTALAVAAVPLLSAVLTWHPRAAMTLWLLSLCFVPYWEGISGPLYLPPTTIVAVLMVPSMLQTKWRRPWNRIDSALAVTLLLGALLCATGAGRSRLFVDMLVQWLPAYLVGRFFASRVTFEWLSNRLAGFLVFAGLLAVVEYVTDFHPWTYLTSSNSLYAIWGPLQERGGHARSEGAWGHAIALGGALVVAIPFVLGSNWTTRRKSLAYGCLMLGILTTESRGPILGAGLATLLTFWVVRKSFTTGQRLLLVVLTIGMAVALLPAISHVASQAGTETSTSTDYRGSLTSSALGDLRPFGAAHNTVISNGGLVYRNFPSVDDAFLAIGIGFGFVFMLCFVIGLALPVVRSLRRQGSLAEVALAASFPILLTVAFITQYAMLIFFLVGVVAEIRAPAAKAATRSVEARIPTQRRLTTGRRPRGGSAPVRPRRLTQLEGAA